MQEERIFMTPISTIYPKFVLLPNHCLLYTSPDNRLSGNIPESTGIQCPQLHSRMPPGLQPSFLRLGCRRTISHCGLRTESRRLVVHSRWSHFRYSSYPSRLPGTPHWCKRKKIIFLKRHDTACSL